MGTAGLSNLEQYLRRYAEPEVDALDTLPPREPWTHLLVVPACNETSRFLNSVPPCPGRSLLILVVNENVQASSEVTDANQALAGEVRTRFESQWCSQPGRGNPKTGRRLELLSDPGHARDVLLVDRFSPGHQLPNKGGVGYARKVGSDLALAMFHRGYFRSPWIHCSDADVELPETYFAASSIWTDQAAKCSALVYPFRHCGSDNREEQKDVVLATRLYEIALNYYVAGLKQAGSPYAFQTIGSTLAVNVHSYAAVRGFPRREAGEDFYLLNKLAKVGKIQVLEEGPECAAIRIACRRSDRVPFGTGAAVNIITGLEYPVRDYRFYHPAVFQLLQDWLECWPAIWKAGPGELSNISDEGSALHGLRPLLLQGLNALNTDKALEHAFRQSKNFDQFTRQMHTWFDAFRTLKLIHFLRDKGLPTVSHLQLNDHVLFIRLLKNDPGLAAAWKAVFS